jgi:prepilin-type N-terminal cleavage/methylation domain-containing protein
MSLACQRRSRSAGFSLIEVLIALAIASLMAVVLTRFVAGTRMNAGKVDELLEMNTLGETLLTRVAALPNFQAGRTDGRSGVYSWRVDIAPLAYTTVTRRMNDRNPNKPPAAANRGATRMTMTPITPTSVTAASAAAARPTVDALIPYRVAVSIAAPSGRRHATDTIRIAPASANNR